MLRANRGERNEVDSDDEYDANVPIQQRAPSTRARKKPRRSGDELGDEEQRNLFAANPEQFGLHSSGIDKYEEENEQREQEAHETTTGGRSGGMSGIARSDKGDEFLEEWLLEHRPADPAMLITDLADSPNALIRHTQIDLDARVVGERVPDQSVALARLPIDALEELAQIGATLTGSSSSAAGVALAAAMRAQLMGARAAARWDERLEERERNERVRERVEPRVDFGFDSGELDVSDIEIDGDDGWYHHDRWDIGDVSKFSDDESDIESSDELHGRGDVSANKVMQHQRDGDEFDRRGYEILHMTGRAVGNPSLMLPPDAQADLIGDISMADWNANTSGSAAYNDSQHPGNLAIGSVAANTLMMPIEGAVQGDTKGFTVDTRAYALRGPRHVAQHIVMTIRHKVSGAERSYYINGLSPIAPEEVYRHIQADVEAFVAAAPNAQAGSDPTVYEYPDLEALLRQRAAAVQQAKVAAAAKAGSSPQSSAVAQPAAATLQVGPTTFFLNQTAGAGNCFFHALHEAKTGQRSSLAAQQAEREAVLDAIRNNDQMAQSNFNGVDTDDFNRFATALLLQGNWVENQTPSYIADATGLTIVIHNPDGSVKFTAQPNAAFGVPAAGSVHLSYDGYHYNSYTTVALP